MTTEEKLKLITQNIEEVITEADLKALIEKGAPLKHYIGYEISGKIHLGTGLATSLVIRDLQKAGVECVIFLADWHTWLNHKLGGDKEIIGRVAVGYFKEGLKASLKCVGADPENIKFVLGSELYHNNDKHWETFVKTCQNLSLARVQKSLSIMGREMKEGIDFGMLLYPPLQVTDIFSLSVNIAHGGTDQRKAHVLMREVGEPVAGYKAVAIHNHLLLGLGKPSAWPIDKENLREVWTSLKMSKSKPETCIFIHDSVEDIQRKIAKAFCPPKETEFNPILDWVKYLIFPIRGKLEIKRETKYGGDIIYNNFASLENDYREDKLFAQDLKNGVVDSLIEILEPARQRFAQGKPREMLKELEKLL